MLQESIKKLVQYGIDTGLTEECESLSYSARWIGTSRNAACRGNRALPRSPLLVPTVP